MVTVRARRRAGAVGDWLNSCTTSAFDDSFAFTDLDGAVLYSCLDEAPVSLAYRRALNGLQFKFPAIYKDFDWNWEPVDVGGTLSPVSAWYRNAVVHGRDQRVHHICMYTDTREAAGELSPRLTVFFGPQGDLASQTEEASDVREIARHLARQHPAVEVEPIVRAETENLAADIRQATELPIAELAEIFDVAERTYGSWLAGQNMSSEHETRAARLRYELGRVADSLDPSGVRIWLRSPNRETGVSPLELLKDKKDTELGELVDALLYTPA